MSRTVPTHDVILTLRDKRQEVVECQSLEQAQESYARWVNHPALWNIAIYNRRGICILDFISERNRVTVHADRSRL